MYNFVTKYLFFKQNQFFKSIFLYLLHETTLLSLFLFDLLCSVTFS